MSKILIIHISAIGDVISATPALNYLKKKFGKLDIITKKSFAKIYSGDDLINIVSREEAIAKRYDYLVDFTSSKESRFIAWRIKADKKIVRVTSFWNKMANMLVYDIFVPKFPYNNIVNDFYPLIEYFGAKSISCPMLETGNDLKVKETIQSLKLNRKVVGIHVGSQNTIKIVPERIFSGIINYLKTKAVSVFLVGTEKDIAERIIDLTDGYPAYYSLDLGEMKTAFGQMDLFIGADSGLLHMAGACGIKAIGIYGPTLSKNYAPASKLVSIIEKDIECRPCSYSVCPRGRECLENITADEIIEVINKKLAL